MGDSIEVGTKHQCQGPRRDYRRGSWLGLHMSLNDQQREWAAATHLAMKPIYAAPAQVGMRSTRMFNITSLKSPTSIVFVVILPSLTNIVNNSNI